MALEQTLNKLNQIGLHGNENHHIIIEIDDWLLVLGSICGIAINKEVEEDETLEISNSGHACYDLSEDNDYWYCNNPNKWCFDSFWLGDKREVAEEAHRMKIHGFKYKGLAHTMPFKKIEA